MEELVNWYWEHGIRRGYDANDPDRELRKISIGGWLDPIVRIIDRNKAIRSNVNAKACLALWGPSQTGKSTMISRYVDGMLDDGSDSALTWSSAHKTRFSPPKDGVELFKQIAPDTVIFNPFNQQSDASGVATRYTLQKAADGLVNPDFPIEIKFTTRAQIIQSLSLGYLSECFSIGEHFDYTQETFMEEVAGEAVSDAAPDPEAYRLLKDIADVIEFMKGVPRFNNLFRRGDWDKKIRKALVSSPQLLGSVDAAEKFMAKIFWDSSEILTRVYKEAARILDDLTAEWRGCKVLATMEVGALLVDIDSFKWYANPELGGDGAERIKEKVSQLAYEKAGNDVHIFLRPSGSRIAGENFAYFQAICAELRVPLKRENLETDPSKNTFLELAEKCDFLDFPGVSNRNVGNNVGEGNTDLIDLTATPSLTEIFTRVFKQGKTQCVVYGYVRKYGIDAFSILVRSNLNPAKSSLLNDGVREWLCSFDPEWLPGRRADMPVFVNMTFFAALLNIVAQSGVGAGLRPYVERVQELTFARTDAATFFATTYQQFDQGKILHALQEDSTIRSILADPVFVSSTGLTEENLHAVYSQDGGLDYMFANIARAVNSNRRIDRCRVILEKDKKELRRLIASQLPSAEDAMSDAQKAKLLECKRIIEETLTRIEEDDNSSEYREFAADIKNLFSAPCEVFDPIPQNATNMSKREILTYVRNQISKWYSYKTANLEDSEYLTLEQKQTILIALRDSVDGESLFQIIRNSLGQINTYVMAEAARYPFSLAFGNLLQKGSLHVESDTSAGDRNPVILDTFIQAAIEKDSGKHGSPYCHVILSPFIARLETMSENCRAGARPPQEGDAELKAISDRIETSATFQI
jgi:hypothetical protein